MAEADLPEQWAWRAFKAGNYLEAAQLYEPLAAVGSETALVNLGWMHSAGHLGPPDLEKAKSLWEKAASAGSASAKNYLASHSAWDAFQAGAYLESARLYEPLAALGWEDALDNLAWMHWRGQLGPVDRAKAISLWERAAGTGSASAGANLAWARREEEHRAWKLMDECKYAESAQLFEPLAALGSEHALNCLGWMYSEGHLGSADLDTAISFWDRAENSVYAKRNLGWAWRKKGDLQRARASYLAGAELGSMPCMWHAGRMMVRGQGGAVDRDTGAAWIFRSAGSGKLFAPDAQWRLEMGRSPSLAKRLSFFFWHATLLGLRRLGRDCRDPYSPDIE